MKNSITLILSLVFWALGSAKAQEAWPRVITAGDGTSIRVYQPEPEYFKNNVLKFRSAISLQSSGQTDPVFGTFWSTSRVQTDRDNREVFLESVSVTDLKVPAVTDAAALDPIKAALESQLPQAMGALPMDEILTSLDENRQEAKLSNDISTKPPRIVYASQPSILVLIDGNPKLERNSTWGLDAVINTPFTIVKANDNQFYLFGGHHWYVGPSALGPYSFAARVPEEITRIETQAPKNNNVAPAPQSAGNASASKGDINISNVIVSTTPAELVQSEGEANFTPIQGTGLLYVKNSDNDIFMDVNSQWYYVLISGRWYHTRSLTSDQWEYIASDRLPADFGRIPEGSAKDNVLASVAGTDAAREAVLDAQIPQTAKVDRHSANTNVVYNGQPQFTEIPGTELQYAVNTSSTVLRSNANGMFYTVDNGVWFVSSGASGPWSVATDRPEDVDRIPPSNPAYNTKFVYVYDVTPDYVYMGYTPGYLNSYIYGPTVVYGTGFYYNPWFGGYYYPRPWSWGFNFGYNPWYGWSFGFNYSLGWFNFGWGWGWGGYYGGFFHPCWWGPHLYHPAYCAWGGGYHPYGGFYGRNVTINNTYNYTRVNNINNIYNNRSGVAARTGAAFGPSNTNRQFTAGSSANNYARGGSVPRSSAASSNPYRAPGNGGTSPNGFSNNRYAAPGSSGRGYNVFSDRQGNVYQRSGQGWQQSSNRSWAPVTNGATVQPSLERSQMQRDRGMVRSQNFQSARSSFGGGGAAPRSFGGGGGGGGSHPSGGGGGGGGRGGRR